MSKKSTDAPASTFNPEEFETKLKNELKDELRTYLDDKLDDRFLDKIENANKKLLSEKSRKIIFRDLFILILLALSVFLTTILYNEGYFNRFFNHATEPTATAETSSTESSSESTFSVSVKEAKEKYAPLLDSFRLSKTSLYASDFLSGKLTDNLKLYFALDSLNFADFKTEGESNLIDRSVLLSASEKLFKTAPSAVSFDYNSTKLRYFEALETFISDAPLKKADSDFIDLEIAEISEDGETVIIKTKNSLKFTFEDKKLISLSKISEN